MRYRSHIVVRRNESRDETPRGVDDTGRLALPIELAGTRSRDLVPAYRDIAVLGAGLATGSANVNLDLH